MSHLDTILGTGLVPPDATVATYAQDDGTNLHLAVHCPSGTGLWTGAGRSELRQLAALPADRRCACLDELDHFTSLLDAGDVATLRRLAEDPDPDADVAPTLRVSRLRHRAYRLRHQRTPALAALAAAAADDTDVLADAIRETRRYRADAALQLLKQIERLTPADGPRLRRRRNVRLSLALEKAVNAVFAEAGDDLELRARLLGSGVHGCDEDTLDALVRVWKVACRDRAWFRTVGGGSVRPSDYVLGVADHFSSRDQRLRFVRAPLAILRSRNVALHVLTLDGDRARDQVVAAARICGDRLDDIEDTLAALDVTADTPSPAAPR